MNQELWAKRVFVFAAVILALTTVAKWVFAEQYRIVVEPSPHHITWTQVTLDYDSTQARLLDVQHGPDVGGRMSGVVVNDGPGTPGFPVYTPGANRHVTFNFVGEYSGQSDVARLWFDAPVDLRLDVRDVAGNDPTHLITDVPSYIEPGDVLLEIEEVVSASVPASSDVWGAVKGLYR